MTNYTKILANTNNFKDPSSNFMEAVLRSHLKTYPTPGNLNYFWSFGFLASLSLFVQLITGILIAMYYKASSDHALSSIEFLMRDARSGWLIRYVHANGASLFFVVVYLHFSRNMYYASYVKPRITLWFFGVSLFLIMMATAFTGYVLPWGQMSFWAATVITNLVTVLPIGSQTILEWLWGGFVIKNPTLHRFFVIHFFLPFIIGAITLIHLLFLHRSGSNSSIGSENTIDNISFHPYFLFKDVFALWFLLFLFEVLVFYYSNYLNHSINYIPSEPFKTPNQIIPEWYFLSFFSILRSIPHKTGGIVAMGLSITVFFMLPYLNTSKIRNSTNRPFFKFFLWLCILNFFILIFIGTHNGKKDIVIHFTQIFTIFYFIYFFIVFPFSGLLEILSLQLSSFITCFNKINNIKKTKFKILLDVSLVEAYPSYLSFVGVCFFFYFIRDNFDSLIILIKNLFRKERNVFTFKIDMLSQTYRGSGRINNRKVVVTEKSFFETNQQQIVLPKGALIQTRFFDLKEKTKIFLVKYKPVVTPDGMCEEADIIVSFTLEPCKAAVGFSDFPLGIGTYGIVAEFSNNEVRRIDIINVTILDDAQYETFKYLNGVISDKNNSE